MPRIQADEGVILRGPRFLFQIRAPRDGRIAVEEITSGLGPVPVEILEERCDFLPF